MENKTLAVCIAAYRAGRWILDSIESVQSQEMPSGWSLDPRIGTDGCPDTEKVLKKAGISYYRSPDNHGPYVIRNSLLTLRPFDAALVFDADDVMRKGMIKTLLPVALKHGLASPYKQGTDTKLKPIRKLSRAKGITMFTKDVWDRMGGFYPERVSMDVEFVKRAERAGYRRVWTDEAVFDRRIHQDSLTRNKKTAVGSTYRQKAKERARGVRKDKGLKTDLITVPMEFISGSAGASVETARKKEKGKPGGAVDAVCTLGTGSKYGNRELRYAVRFLQKNVTGLRDLIIIGSPPPRGLEWRTGEIKHLESPEKGLPRGDADITAKILRACDDPDISDPFLMFHDDHYVIKPFRADNFPAWHKPVWECKSKNTEYRKRAENTYKTLKKLGVDSPGMYDLHAPLLIYKEDYKSAMEKTDWRSGHILCKSVYANLSENLKYRKSLPDCKVRRMEGGLEDRPWFSTTARIDDSLWKWMDRLLGPDTAEKRGNDKRHVPFKEYRKIIKKQGRTA